MTSRMFLLATVALIVLTLTARVSVAQETIAVKLKLRPLENGMTLEEAVSEAVKKIETEYDIVSVGGIGSLESGYHLFEAPVGWTGWSRTRKIHARMADDETVEWVEAQTELQRRTRSVTTQKVTDPLFPFQWHLNNVVARKNGVATRDINVTSVWNQGICGSGVTVAVVDDGIDYRHKDFNGRYTPVGSYDFNLRRPEPLPMLRDDFHGTRCAGEISAGAGDGVCGAGVAYCSNVAGLRMLSGAITDAIEASALSYSRNTNSIYSNSWGPWDNGETVEAPSYLCQLALREGTEKGRNGLGSIFVFASGNGGPVDNCNFDGYANSIYVSAIGSLDVTNHPSPYQEPCVARLASAYTGDSWLMITTTDVNGMCTDEHSGTSAAAPLAAGMAALVLQVNPQITWRDFQYLVILSSVKSSIYVPEWSDRSDWILNAANLYYHENIGFGRMDAYWLTQMAKNWPGLEKHVQIIEDVIIDSGESIFGLPGPMTVFYSQELTRARLEDFDLGDIGNEDSTNFRLEHVGVTISISHLHRGEISVALVSPSGTTSTLATPRPKDRSRKGLNGWTFNSVAFWGEDPIGEWTVIIKDTVSNRESGSVDALRLVWYGSVLSESVLSMFTPV